LMDALKQSLAKSQGALEPAKAVKKPPVESVETAKTEKKKRRA